MISAMWKTKERAIKGEVFWVGWLDSEMASPFPSIENFICYLSLDLRKRKDQNCVQVHVLEEQWGGEQVESITGAGVLDGGEVGEETLA